MNGGLKKFRELLLTDKEFQKKLRNYMEEYTGEQTEEAVFNAVLVPLAAEYNITAPFDEFRAFILSMSDDEMSRDELQQIAGGKTAVSGAGASGCYYVGIGIGGIEVDPSNYGSFCVVIGFGKSSTACWNEGTTA